MLVEVFRITICPCESMHLIPKEGKWVPVRREEMPLKFQSLAARYMGYRVSDRDDLIRNIVLKLEPELIDDTDVKGVRPWELYHRDGADGAVDGMKLYTVYLKDGSHIKAAITEDAYSDLRG